MTYYIYYIECRTPHHHYVGMTKNLSHRIRKHQDGKGAVFTKKYGYKNHCLLETTDSLEKAKQLEKEWTLELVRIAYGRVCGYGGIGGRG